MQLRIVSLTISLLAMQACAMQQGIVECSQRIECFSTAATRSCIIEQLQLKDKVENFGQNIRSLSCVNKDFRSYFADEGFREQLVLQMQGRWGCMKNETGVLLWVLKFTAMESKLQKFFDVAKGDQKNFSQEQLEDIFYLNALDTFESLLDVANENNNEVAMKQLLSSKNFNIDDSRRYNKAQNQIFEYLVTPEDVTKELILRKIQLFLDHMNVIDYRTKLSEKTLLMEAAMRGCDAIARLLLFKGANPYVWQIEGMDIYKGETLSELLKLSKQQFTNFLESSTKSMDKETVLRELRSEKAQEALSVDCALITSAIELQSFTKEAIEEDISMMMKALKDAFDFAGDCKTKAAGWFKTLVDSVTAEKAEKEVGDVVQLLLGVKYNKA